MDISTDNKTHLHRFRFEPPTASYIAGFIDGDGCMFIRKITDGYQSGFSITQCRTNILQVLKYHFGGSITSSENRNNKFKNIMDENNEFIHKHNTRNQYNLSIRSNEYKLLLEYLQNSFIIKDIQYKCLYEFNKITNLPNKIEQKEELYKICSENNVKTTILDINFNKLNIEYIAGLFDAEGCLFINKTLNKFYISISQKNHPSILYQIVKFIGVGNVRSNIEFVIYNKPDCLQFIQLVKQHLIVKYNQAHAFEQFLKSTEPEIKKQMYSICNQEKHNIEIFTDLNQNELGKEMYLNTLHLRNIKTQFCKEILIKQVYREKSEKMKGEGNHNFGKTFSEETRKKMSSSIRDAKGGVSDDIITHVRQLIDDGCKNIEIQKLLNLPRHTVTQIKNKKLVCRNEEKKTTSLTQEEVNLSKRKIQTNEIIIVIEKLIDNWKPIKILNHLIEIRNHNNVQNNLSIDIIKNIKRNLTNKKVVIYETELTKEKYDYCMQLINTFYKKLV